MAALSPCLRWCLRPGSPGGLLLCFRRCQSVQGPSEYQLQCRGQGEPVLSDESIWIIAAPGPAPGEMFVELRLLSHYTLPPFSLHSLAASLTLTDTDLTNRSLLTI